LTAMYGKPWTWCTQHCRSSPCAALTDGAAPTVPRDRVARAILALESVPPGARAARHVRRHARRNGRPPLYHCLGRGTRAGALPRMTSSSCCCWPEDRRGQYDGPAVVEGGRRKSLTTDQGRGRRG
jgi:hypothetical protein